MILRELGHAERTCELGGLAAYLHDIGNVITRDRHHVSSAFIAYDYLRARGIQVDELTPVLSAIGNHEESIGVPVGSVAAAVIIADKSDVHRSRVQNDDKSTFDIHDRVNWSAVASDVQVDREHRGGSVKAVCAYCADHFPIWEKQTGTTFCPGIFGENLSVTELPEDAVHIGDVFSIGEAAVQVSQPRQPCHKLSKKLKDLTFENRVIESGFTVLFPRSGRRSRPGWG